MTESVSKLDIAINRITGGVEPPTNLLERVCSTRPITFVGKTVREDQEIIKGVIEKIVGRQLPKDLGSDFWKKPEGQKLTKRLEIRLANIPDPRSVK